MTSRLLLFFIIIVIGSVSLPAQSSNDEFVSIRGRFAIGLPQAYSEYRPVFRYELAGETFEGSSYRWQVGDQQAAVSFADGSINLENPSRLDSFLNAVRDDFVKKSPTGSLVGEKRTSLDGKVGLIFVVQSDMGRTMRWVYLDKNRIYFLSLSVNDPAKAAEQVKVLSTFRLVTQSELEPRYAKLVDELAPSPLPQETKYERPTSDLQDLGLEGPVRRIVTESEPYSGPELLGVRNRGLDEEFSELGHRTKSVIYSGGLPEVVRLYGYLKGERVFREQRKEPNVVLMGASGVLPSKQPTNKFRTELFTLKYKHDDGGRLTEIRLFQEDGQEREKHAYSSGKLEHTYYPLSFIIGLSKALDGDKVKDVSSLDASGNVIETSRTKRDGSDSSTIRVENQYRTEYADRYKTEKFKYQYEFDDRGNWIKRVTISLDKKKDGVPLSTAYRSITYY